MTISKEAVAVRELSDPEHLARNPVVSVVMLAYNHAEYLVDAIEGVAMQKVDFPIELIVAEDGSNDGTFDIASDAQKSRPDLIRVLYSETNVGMHANLIRAIRAARGRFIAFCEGDDYWCDPQKLADQVELLERDPDIGLVHSDYIPSQRVLGLWPPIMPTGVKARARIPLSELEGDIRSAMFIRLPATTCTAVYRKELIDRALFEEGNYSTEWPVADLQLLASVAERSRAGYLARPTAIYRLSPNSVMRSGWRSRLGLARKALQFREQYIERKGVPADFYGDFRPVGAAMAMMAAIFANDMASLRALMESYGSVLAAGDRHRFNRAAASPILFLSYRAAFLFGDWIQNISQGTPQPPHAAFRAPSCATRWSDHQASLGPQVSPSLTQPHVSASGRSRSMQRFR